MSNLNSMGVGYDLYTKTLNEFVLGKKMVINTINQYSFCMAEQDEEFKKALMNSDVLLPDGDGIVLAERFLTGKKIKKISGADLHAYLLSYLNKTKGKCFYLGSSSSTLDKIKNRLKREYPDLQANFYSPPFTQEFSDTDNEEMINSINEFKPDVLFVGLTAPKQEKWSIDHKQEIDAKLVCGIGAVFDFYAGTVERPSQVWIDMHLEWLGRFIQEPRRLWRRYLYYGPVYLYMIFKKKFSSDKSFKPQLPQRAA
ncbi:WecB/TagA/CpsF family glycosyltransferase [Pedobacter mucosus]|uniref:WecB/TagA/CpsF family glycosyltransferase n=1 Tax=Pedobacter mucosus TaxID=2895286 RepID=UPI001EE450C0|nr:WecB/TagA/CpsF family glycosyltransferase [Pedobacter mucosus]UKT62405.1 WecB/TagA/CpsF family glycosyltransferase [Pedobacter mucosus]